MAGILSATFDTTPQQETVMRAVAYKTPGPIDRDDALQDVTLEVPEAEGWRSREPC